MIAGTAYSVILNDRFERSRLAETFAAAPYMAPPAAPVVYIKPRNCFASCGGTIALPDDIVEVTVAATVGLWFDRDTTSVGPAAAMANVAAACLAIDVSMPHDGFYRPPIAQRCRDGFLPMGSFGARPTDPNLEIVTRIDRREVHVWSLDRLVRPIGDLIAELSAFMTLRAGDMLLIGLPGDAPRARRGQSIEIEAAGLPTLRSSVGGDA